jgi:pimeloyl-ACP methyl ester carboxylesterase
MMNSIDTPLTLYSLNNLVHNVIADALPSRYWITGELSEVRETAVGHCYIELVQRDEETQETVAKARGTIWARIYSLLRPYFLEQTGQPFAAGLKVLLQVTVSFHELYGYTLDDMRPIEALDGNTIPVLFMHGDADTTVPPQSAQELYDRASGVRELHYVAGADHAESVLKSPEEYREVVVDFLGRV